MQKTPLPSETKKAKNTPQKQKTSNIPSKAKNTPPIRNTPSDSRTRTFYPDILPNFPDTFILGDFNAHHPTWDRLIPPNPLGNDLFRWITSSGLEILNDPASPTLLHHSTGSRSSPDISLAPVSLAPHCEWRTLPGLGSDHLPIEIVLPLSPVCHPNTRPPKFNYKKASWDVYQSYIAGTFPLLILMHSTSTRLPTPFPSS